MNGIKNFKYVALDSNVFIYNLEQNFKFIRFTDAIFKGLITSKLAGVTSIITLTEILSYPQTEAQAGEIIEDFLNTPNLTVLELNQKIAIMAAKIRRTCRFLIPDAVQLATAVEYKAQTFITNDKRLKAFKELPITLLTEVK
ncbi:PIN domain-containing protein [Candidatus Curtissbacteria bacterium]|nr:PIN domain-containing protein [Candidatus Curtissbacteria bacterium]